MRPRNILIIGFLLAVAASGLAAFSAAQAVREKCLEDLAEAVARGLKGKRFGERVRAVALYDGEDKKGRHLAELLLRFLEEQSPRVSPLPVRKYGSNPNEPGELKSYTKTRDGHFALVLTKDGEVFHLRWLDARRDGFGPEIEASPDRAYMAAIITAPGLAVLLILGGLAFWWSRQIEGRAGKIDEAIREGNLDRARSLARGLDWHLEKAAPLMLNSLRENGPPPRVITLETQDRAQLLLCSAAAAPIGLGHPGGENDVGYANKAVSRKHLVIQARDGGYVAEDAGSSNGTTLNGERLEGPATLKDGDVLNLGTQVEVKARLVEGSLFLEPTSVGHPSAAIMADKLSLSAILPGAMGSLRSLEGSIWVMPNGALTIGWISTERPFRLDQVDEVAAVGKAVRVIRSS